MRYYIAHLPKGPIEKYHRALVQDLITRFDLKMRAGYFPAHVTLKAPFDATQEQIDNLKALLGSFSQIFCEAPDSISFMIDGFMHFDKNVIALKVEPSARMRLIIATLNELLLNGFPWMTREEHEPLQNFHITIAKKDVAGRFDEVWEYLDQKDPPLFDLHFDNIALLRFENDTWVVNHVYQIVPNIKPLA